MKDAGKNTLKTNRNGHAIYSILNNTKIQGKPAVAWRLASGKKITAEVFFRVVRKSRGELLLRGTDPANQKILSTLISGRDKINIFLPEDMALFQAEIKSYETFGDATVKIPRMIAQVDRRKHLRLFLGEESLATARFFKESKLQSGGKQLFDKSCHDLSAGGLSFVVSRMEGKFFAKGELLKGLAIRAENREARVDAKIVSIHEVEPDGQNKLHYRGLKVCVNYTAISDKDRKFLNDLVFRHSDLGEAV